MIGFLLPRKKLAEMVNSSDNRENLQFYLQLADKHQIDILLYSLNRLDLTELTVKGFYYSVQAKTLTEITTELPKINFFRIVLKRSETYQRFKTIEQEHNVQFINLVPPRDKYTIYQQLTNNQDLTKHIPYTQKLTFKRLNSFLQEYQRVIIKPINGSLGEDVYLIQKNYNKLLITHIKKRKKHFNIINRNYLYRLYRRSLAKRKYILQPWISFKKIDGNKFDIRTSIQKDVAGEWKMTGIVGRVATKQGIVTNIAQGGYAISYASLNQLLEEEAYTKIERLSIEIALELEKLYPAIVDLGLDIGIDKQDALWFIEANFCDERYAYHELGDNDMWFRSYQYPFEYAVSKYKQK